MCSHKAFLLLMSHLGRPKGGFDAQFSLKAAADVLAGLLGIRFKWRRTVSARKWKPWQKALSPAK